MAVAFRYGLQGFGHVVRRRCASYHDDILTRIGDLGHDIGFSQDDKREGGLECFRDSLILFSLR